MILPGKKFNLKIGELPTKKRAAAKSQPPSQKTGPTLKTISWEDLNRAQAVAQMGCWRLQLDQNELFWSDETYRIFGIEPGTPMTYETFLATVHPEDREYVDRQWQQALAGAPYDIEHRIVVHGSLKWVRERAELEFDAQGRLLGGFGTVQDITDCKQIELALQQSQERLRFLANQLLTSQEQERKRLALELHDELSHALLTLKFSLRDIAQKLPPEHADVKHLLQEQLVHIKQVIQRVRRLYRDLSPGDVENLGLIRALKSLVEDFAGLFPHIVWELDLPELTGPVPLSVQTIIYRLVQESLTNIGKHAQPTRVCIAARQNDHQVQLTVEDNGRGFDPAEVDRDPARGLGLAAMRERLYPVGGFLEIHSRKGQGTRFTFTIPTFPPGAEPR